MADGSVVIDSRIDDDGVDRGIDKIQFKLGSLNLSLLKTAALSQAIELAPALVPMLATASAAAMGLAASLAAAGIGVAAFGTVAMGVFSELKKKEEEIKKLRDKIDKQSDPKKRAELEKKLAVALGNLSKEERRALDEMEKFGAFWKKFLVQFQKPVFDIMGNGLHFVQELLKGLAPTIKGVADVYVRFTESLDQDISNNGFAGFFKWLETNAVRALENFMIISGNIFGGFFGLIGAFSPLGAEMEGGLINLTERFKVWGQTVGQSQGFKNFISYVKENTPKVLDFIKNVFKFVKDLLVALAPLGSTALDTINNLLGSLKGLIPIFEDVLSISQNIQKEINEHWPLMKEVIIGLGVAVGVFVGTMKGLMIISTINTLMKAWRAGTLAATLAQMGLNTALWLSPVTWIVMGIAALIAIGVLLYRNWDTVKAKTMELWDKLGKFKLVVIGLLGPIGWIIAAGVLLYKNWDLVKFKATELWDMLKLRFALISETAKEKFGAMKDAIMDPIREAVEFVLEKIGQVKELFDELKLKFPKIDIPFVGGKSGSGKEPKIKGYANGGLFSPNSPTLIGIGDNKKYQEAALPLSPSVLGMIGQKIADTMPSGGSNKQPAIIQIVTPDKTEVATWLVDELSTIQEFNMGRKKRF